MEKYLQNSMLINWLRMPTHCFNSASRTWTSLTRTIPIITHWLSWRPGSGHLISIGRDQILGIGNIPFLDAGASTRSIYDFIKRANMEEREEQLDNTNAYILNPFEDFCAAV
jgi:hypothetical protein